MCEHEGHHGPHGHRHGEGHGRGHGEHHRHHRHGGECRCGWGDAEPGLGFRRRFQTQEEQIGELEEYLRQLQAEAKAVEEQIARLRA